MKARSGAARGAGSGEREKWTAGAENPDGHRWGFDPDEAPQLALSRDRWSVARHPPPMAVADPVVSNFRHLPNTSVGTLLRTQVRGTVFRAARQESRSSCAARRKTGESGWETS
jgi:hypothetical protein